METKDFRLDEHERKEFYQVMMGIHDKPKDPVFVKRVDDIMAIIGDQAISVGKKEGYFQMFRFINEKCDSLQTKLAAAKRPRVTPAGLAMRGEIERDLEARLKTVRSGLTLNPSSSFGDPVKAEWNSDPELRREFGDNYQSYVAYKKAQAEGRVRIAGGKIIRGDREHERQFNNFS
jgi:hypothetical protein